MKKFKRLFLSLSLVAFSTLSFGAVDNVNRGVVVDDNGQGFAADILPRAFEPYITNKAKGTGLGWAVVKKIIEEHHGSIHLGHSAAGGARVRVVLPCAEQA